MNQHIKLLKLTALIMAIVFMVFPLVSCKGKKYPTESINSDSGISNNSENNGSSDTIEDVPSESTSNSNLQSSNDVPTPAPNQNSNTKSNSAADTKAPVTTTSTTSNIKTLVIPEGWTVSQIANRLEANGVCTKAEYLNAINHSDFTKYWPDVVNCVPSNDPHRTYKFEGYQFPNTYKFHVKQDASDVVGTMLRGAQNNIISKSYKYPGMTTDQIVTLASILELEASKPSDRRMISAILHQRLKKGMQLQCDSATKYIEYFSNLSYDLKRSFAPYYNTYKCPALPSGPICNPGADALNAAVNPAQNTEGYLYFFSDKSGVIHYNKTLAEHDKQLIEYGIVSATRQ